MELRHGESPPLAGQARSPGAPTFRPDDITAEVVDLVKSRFGSHPGTPDARALPASAAQVARLWSWAREACLEHFGPFEDAMSTASRGLFHTRISPLLNLHRLLPRQIVADVAADERLPLSSREGFVRQVLGWREFVRHVHEATDGFRRIGTRDTPVDPAHGGATPSFLDATRPLPAAYWGTPSGLACLDTVVREVWEDGWSHHITRLMVLANLATLLDVSPRELTDWFWVAYVDAYDWVVEPNVLAMGTYAVGDVMTTKPYVSGAAYIARMSDYCQGCAFDPVTTCPITPLYRAFLARHADALERNPRMRLIMQSLRRRSRAQRESAAAVFARVSDALAQGRPLAPGPDASAD